MNHEYIQDIITEKALDAAKRNAEIVDLEISLACEKLNCEPKDLILEYHHFSEIKIKFLASHFKIENKFIYNGAEIENYMDSIKEKLK